MEINVNDFSTDNIDPTGTSFRGYLKVSYADLVKKLGEPTDDFDDCKSDAAWNIQWNDGMVATIYNWKNGKNYLGAQGLKTEDILIWNIGGESIPEPNLTNPVEVDRLHELLKFSKILKDNSKLSFNEIYFSNVRELWNDENV